MKEINEVQVLLDAGATIATEEDLSRVTATDRKVLPFQSYTTKADWLRSEIEKLGSEKMNENLIEGDFALALQTQAVNGIITSIITRYKEELKVLTGE